MAEPAVAPAAPSPTPPPVAPPAATPAAAPPAAPPRGERISDAHYDDLPVDQQANYSRMRKGPDGGSEWRLRSALTPDGTPAASGTTPAPDAPASVSADGKLVIGSGENRMELSGEDVRTIIKEKAERDLRATQVPASAADYKPELPKDLKLPPGVEIAIDANDPAFNDLQAFAHSRGWSQSDLSAALGIFAAREARQSAELQTALRAEIAKLGPNGTQRISAIHQFLRGLVGDEYAKPLASMLVSERHVLALEHLAAKFTSQGAAHFSQSHREPPRGNGRVSDEEYEAMSSAQRWTYAKQFDQRQFKK